MLLTPGSCPWWTNSEANTIPNTKQLSFLLNEIFHLPLNKSAQAPFQSISTGEPQHPKQPQQNSSIIKLSMKTCKHNNAKHL
jgi:hypothetical protein